MKNIHVLTIPDNGKFVLIGNLADAEMLARNHQNSELDSETFCNGHYLTTFWLVESNIKKVIAL